MIEAAEFKSVIGIRHGWFTRRGGHSTGLFSSLNCGYGSGDDRSLVGKNRAHELQDRRNRATIANG